MTMVYYCYIMRGGNGSVVLKETNMGIGVFARDDIEKGAVFSVLFGK